MSKAKTASFQIHPWTFPDFSWYPDFPGLSSNSWHFRFFQAVEYFWNDVKSTRYSTIAS